jgi:hypothetical protein
MQKYAVCAINDVDFCLRTFRTIMFQNSQRPYRYETQQYLEDLYANILVQ